MKIKKVVLILVVTIAVMSNGFMPALGQTAEPAACDGQEASCQTVQPAVQDPLGVSVVRVYYEAPEEIELLSGFDLFEYNNQEERYVLVAVDRAGLARLRSLGFRAEIDPQETANYALLTTPLAQQTEAIGIESIPSYTCYRTVEETYPHRPWLPPIPTWPPGPTSATPGRRAWASPMATT